MPNVQNFATFGESVDLANGFAGCWTHGGSFDDVTEWARQLRDELIEVLARIDGPDSRQGETL